MVFIELDVLELVALDLGEIFPGVGFEPGLGAFAAAEEKNSLAGFQGRRAGPEVVFYSTEQTQIVGLDVDGCAGWRSEIGADHQVVDEFNLPGGLIK